MKKKLNMTKQRLKTKFDAKLNRQMRAKIEELALQYDVKAIRKNIDKKFFERKAQLTVKTPEQVEFENALKQKNKEIQIKVKELDDLQNQYRIIQQNYEKQILIPQGRKVDSSQKYYTAKIIRLLEPFEKAKTQVHVQAYKKRKTFLEWLDELKIKKII